MTECGGYQIKRLTEAEYEEIKAKERDRRSRLEALRREGAFLDQYLYGRSTDADYFKED